MFRIAICDDNNEFLEQEENILKKHLEEMHVKHVISAFQSCEEFIKKIKDGCSYDLVILDVEMPEINGMEIAKLIRKYSITVNIAFLSAYIKYSPDGYTVNAIRYILKDANTIKEYLCECVDATLKKIDMNKRELSVDFSIGRRSFLISDLLYIESHINNVRYYLSDSNSKERYELRSPLKKITERMLPLGFISINAKQTVNLSHIKSVCRYEALLDNGITLKISQKKYKEVYSTFISFKGENL